MPRKKKPEEEILTTAGVRLTRDIDRAIWLIATKDKVSKSDVMRRLIEIGLSIERQYGDRALSA